MTPTVEVDPPNRLSGGPKAPGSMRPASRPRLAPTRWPRGLPTPIERFDMKKTLAAVAALALAFGFAPVAHAATPTPTSASAAKSDYKKKQRNQFWRVVRSIEPNVRYAGKRDTINLGISTCEYLRAGGTLYGLAAMVTESDAGIAEDAVIAVLATAPVVLCPDQQYKFD